MKVSVIVPVYNVEKYLLKCVSSIQTQVLSDIEIILVDDGSTDFSGTLCDQLAYSDKRIQVIHKNNGGLMAAWITGVKYATGKYIGFVDSDDWIDSNMYSELLHTIETHKSDMVICGLIKNYENGNKESMLNRVESGVYDRDLINTKILPIFFRGDHYSRGVSISRVTKLYKKSLLKEIIADLPEEISIGEDLLTTFRYLMKADKISIMKDFTPYHYRINMQSMTKTYNDVKYKKIELLHNELLKTDGLNSDITSQINTDYLKLTLAQLDDEILFSGRKYSLLRERIKQRFCDDKIQLILRNAEKNQLNLKYQLYILFLKHSFWDAVLLMRMIKK